MNPPNVVIQECGDALQVDRKAASGRQCQYHIRLIHMERDGRLLSFLIFVIVYPPISVITFPRSQPEARVWTSA